MATRTTPGDVRRVVVYHAADGWRWKAQGGNWRTVDAAEEGKTHKHRVLAHVRRRFPNAEIIERQS